MSGALILGIDGGGSHSRLVLADRQGQVLRAANGKGVNPVDNRHWRDALGAVMADFAGDARIAAVAAALPAYGEVATFSAEQQAAVAAAFPAARQRLLNDVDAAHLGAFAGGAGILILSGTGSMAWARDAAGHSHRVGGWGDVIGDEGSAYWIGRAVLARVSQSLDGRAAPTGLVAALFTHLGLDAAHPLDGLEGWTASQPHLRAAIAGLSVLAGAQADAGDAGALQIVEAAAHELARHFAAIAAQAGGDTRWSYAGGAFGCRTLLEALTRKIGTPPVPPRLPPIGGALLAAAHDLNWPADPAWIERLAGQLSAAPAAASGLQPIQ